MFSGLSAYRDAGNITIYAGCANEAVGEVIDLCVEELKTIKRTPVPDSELRRAKDHLKGSLMLSLENTSSRMSPRAREIYFDRHLRPRRDAGGRGSGQHRRSSAWLPICSRTVRWRRPSWARPRRSCRRRGWMQAERHGAGDDSASTNPAMGAIWSDQRRYETWLEVELAAADAMAEAGVIPGGRRRRAQGRGDSTSPASKEIEQVTQHDVIAFTTAVAEHVGPAARWLHFGLPLLGRPRHRAGAADAQACDLIVKDLAELLDAVRARAEEHRGRR